MKIALLMLRYPDSVRSPVTTGVIDHLAEWGAEVDVLYPEEQMVPLNDIRVEYDLYVLKSRTEMALGYAGALHAAGATILNPYPVSARIRDKIALTALLQAAGVPVPEAFITAQPSHLASLLGPGPLVLKPYRGTGMRGVHIVWDPEDLDDVPTNQGPIFAQRLVDRRGTERKIYSIGGQVFGVRRSWPARNYNEKIGESFTVSPSLRSITQLCSQALGIDAFSLDILGDDNAPFVVDVKSFPTFTGVPDAPLRVADYIFDAALRAMKQRRARLDAEEVPS
jgi:glutathione synthase/RimK-type ligase-like ATP-grasp enzyme